MNGLRAIAGSWLLNGDVTLPPLAAGALVLDPNGRILDVGDSAALRGRFPGLRFEQHAAVLMPGLVNAHTHLELSALRGAVPGGKGFVAWLDGLMRMRAERKPEQDSEAIEAAVSELLGFGVAAVGEVCNHLNSVEMLAAVPIAGCVFHEIYGMRREVAEVTLGLADRERAAYPDFPARLHYAVAPHTPYSLHPEILREIVRRACAGGARTSLHLAEHAAERSFLETGGGPFAGWLTTRSASAADWPAPICDSVRYAARLGLLGPNTIVVHLADARPDEIAIVAAAGSPVVLCPRSNLHIELKLPPLLDVLAAGLRPGLGSDSLASNASLDPLAEARALRKRFPTVPAATLLAMASAWGADALGLADRVGRLEKGLAPGVLAFEHGMTSVSDPAKFVLDHESAPRKVLARTVRA
jgi:cytosine/adenosine deaminase-related metal-dependent hydrolase